MLLVLDGWGKALADYPADQDAIRLGRTPFWDSLLEECPNTMLATSGREVGLPDGIMGNSEVGHMNLGAGRIVNQMVVRIDKAIEDHDLKENAELVQAIEKARESGKKLHLMGLVSNAGVHSIDRHYFAILRLAKTLGLPPEQVMVHVFLDGRDTPPKSGLGFVTALLEMMQSENLGQIATLGGRYYAMDRDQRWERTQLAYDALVQGQAEFTTGEPLAGIRAAYERGETDEFVKPTVVLNKEGQATGRIGSDDQIIFFNFRPDRGRQLSRAFVEQGFDGFETQAGLDVELTTLTEYIKGLNATVAFMRDDICMTLGEVVSQAGRTQLRMAETEKYPHVSFFFSGGREAEFEGEDRIMVSSPKVATYDLQPEMSLPEVSEKLEAAIRSGKYDLIVCNFANGDMVGHTGVKEACVAACEAVDSALENNIKAIRDCGGSAVVVADHGNCENLWNFEADCPHTQHTTTPTQCVIVTEDSVDELRVGKLGDAAPTVLQLMGLEQPPEMTGQSIIVG